MFVGNDSPLRPAVLRHSDNERVCAANSFGRPVRIVVCRHNGSDEALHGGAFLKEQRSLNLGPSVAVVARSYLVKYGFGRAQPSGVNQALHARHQSGKNRRRIRIDKPHEDGAGINAINRESAAH